MSLGGTALSVTAILGLLLLVADIYAIVQTLKSSASDVMKVAWVVMIFFLPFVGLVIWLLAGPRAAGR